MAVRIAWISRSGSHIGANSSLSSPPVPRLDDFLLTLVRACSGCSAET